MGKKIIFLSLLLFISSYTVSSDRAVSSSVQERVQECAICGSSQRDQMLITHCCNQCICRNDFEEMERVAHDLYYNLQNPDWRREYAASEDFNGWPEELEHLRCPYCRNYPLRVLTLEQHEEKLPCNICLEEIEFNQMIRLSCNHSYCSDCLLRMIDADLKERTTTNLKCPECAQELDENDMRKIVKNNKDRLDLFYDIKTQEYLATQPNAKHCPTPDCKFVFINEENQKKEIKCPQCNKEYCSKCLYKHSYNVTCEQAAELRPNDNETTEWLNGHTKPCPRCNARIEKDGGCDYVRCKFCNHGFCFRCYGEHHVVNCTNPEVNPINRQQEQLNQNRPLQVQPMNRNLGRQQIRQIQNEAQNIWDLKL